MNRLAVVNEACQMEFVSAIPRLDENVHGFIGRIGCLNGGVPRERLVVGLRKLLNLPPTMSQLHALAQVSGMDMDDFIFRHTMLPMLRTISSHVGSEKEASVEVNAIRLYRVRNNHQSARCCPKCVIQDRYDGGFAYWHRIHFLPRVDWCVIHDEPLRSYPSLAFDRQPEAASSNCADLETPTPPRDWSNPVLNRYAEILQQWLESRSKFSSKALNRVLQDGCRKHDLRCSQQGKRLLPSDLARERLPETWMARHFPELLSKGRGIFLTTLDGPAKDDHVAYPSSVSALALAVLFESADEVQLLLDLANREVLAKMAATIAPSLEAIEAALRSFSEGARLEEVCRNHALAAEHLEPHLRQAVLASLQKTSLTQ